MILRALWVAIGLHPQPEIPLEGPKESAYAFRYFATMKHEEIEQMHFTRVAGFPAGGTLGSTASSNEVIRWKKRNLSCAMRRLRS